MEVNQEFVHTKGTVIGSTHRNSFKNNQDFHWVESNEKAIVTIVADGCGSGAHSEVGVGMVIPRLVADIMYNLDYGTSIEKSIEYSLQSTKERISNWAFGMAGNSLNISQVVENFFLFTIIGTVITEKETVVFSIGDGVYLVNGSIHVIDQNNAPNYLSYTILNNKDPEFVMNVKMPTEAVDSIVIATDGATDIIRNQDQQIKFGLVKKPVGNITQFIEGDMRGSSIRMIKHLNVLSKQNMVSDDTTIITITRTPKGE